MMKGRMHLFIKTGLGKKETKTNVKFTKLEPRERHLVWKKIYLSLDISIWLRTVEIKKNPKNTRDISNSTQIYVKGMRLQRYKWKATEIYLTEITINVNGPFPFGCLHSSITASLSHWNLQRDKASITFLQFSNCCFEK